MATHAERAGFPSPRIEARHAADLRLLPTLHHDPFDCLRLSQAQIEGLTLLSRDAAVRRNGASATRV